MICEFVSARLIPILRRQIAIKMLRKGKKQRAIANSLQITEAAVSQYISKKRANEKGLNKIIKREMEKYDEKRSFAENVCNICKDLRSKKELCAAHIRLSRPFEGECRICEGACW